MSPVLRFAPSPNGRLHLGHAYSALLNERVARDWGGTLLLRIEDIDPARATAERIAGVEADLAWLGLDWPRPARRQSDHMDAYRDAAVTLRSAGLLYPCFCSRGDIAAAVALDEARTGEPARRDPDGTPLYPGTCRPMPSAVAVARIAAGESHAWRIDMTKALGDVAGLCWTEFDPATGQDEAIAAHPLRWGDVVLVRREVATSYHLAVVVDDAIQGITHVVRGRDLLAATDIHALLARRLGLAAPRYHHHRLLTDAAGQKLAKSRDSDSLAAMRAAGVTPGEIHSRLGFA